MVSSSSIDRRDPIARYAWIAMLILAAWINVATSRPPVQAHDAAQPADSASPAGALITPTPALPQPLPEDDPALALSAPTPTNAPEAPAAPADTSQTAPTAAQDGPSATEAIDADNSAYLANIGAQAAHSPRGDVAPEQSFQSGPILYPAENVIIVPAPIPQPTLSAPAAPVIAVAVPPISADQRAVIAQRDQHGGCVAPAVFYPRTGCHVPGAAGAMPGAVGESQP